MKCILSPEFNAEISHQPWNDWHKYSRLAAYTYMWDSPSEETASAPELFVLCSLICAHTFTVAVITFRSDQCHSFHNIFRHHQPQSAEKFRAPLPLIWIICIEIIHINNLFFSSHYWMATCLKLFINVSCIVSLHCHPMYMLNTRLDKFFKFSMSCVHDQLEPTNFHKWKCFLNYCLSLISLNVRHSQKQILVLKRDLQTWPLQ